MNRPSSLAGADAATPLGHELDLMAARALIGFGVAVVTAAAGAVLLLEGLPPQARGAMLAALVLTLVLIGVTWWLTARGHPRLATFWTMLLCTAVNCAVAALAGTGVHAQSFGVSALMIALAGILLGPRQAFALFVLNVGAVAALYQAEMAGWVPGLAAAAVVPAVNRAYTLAVVMAAGFLAALLFARTHRRALEHARKSEAGFRELLRIGTDWLWEQDAAGRFSYLSPGFAARSAMPSDAMIGRALWELEGVVEPPEGWGPLRTHLARGAGLHDEELLVRRADGSLVAFRLSSEPMRDAQGELTGWRGVGRDVTAQARAEARRRESEQILDQLFRANPDGLVLGTLPEGRIVLMNANLSRMVGIAEQDAIGHTPQSLGFWVDEAARAELWQRMERNGHVANLATRVVHRNGHEIPAMLSATRFALNGRDYMVATVRDTSEVERVRLESEVILTHAVVGIALLRGGVFQRVNPTFERIFGREVGSLGGQQTRVMFDDEESYERFAAQVRRADPAGSAEFEWPIAWRDGRTSQVRLRMQTIDPLRPREGRLWIAEDITEQRRAKEQLSHAKDEAEAASRAKSAFLATMSHEMRTPLNGVIGMIRLALDEPGGRRDEYLRHAAVSAQTLAGIISDVLDLSKIEAGRLQLESADFDLHELLAQLHAGNDAAAREKGLALTLRIGDDVPHFVNGDAARVRQVLVNYLGNALKFTERGAIELRVARADAGLRFEVRDSGSGIAPEVQARLFQPFAQGDESTTRRFGGTGLGLSICRELAHLMGGEVGVESRPGAGSVFWAELPLTAARAPALPRRGPRNAPLPLADWRVLVVEDHPVNMLIAVETLKRWGAQAVEAVDGQAALQAVDEAFSAGVRFDAVLMDLHMPDISGIEVTRRLRQRFDARALPIVALTAAALLSEQQQALEAGMNDFVTKPIDSRQLLEALRRTRRGPVTA